MEEKRHKINIQINTDKIVNECQAILRETQESVLFGLYLIQSNTDTSSFAFDSIGGSEFSFRFEPAEKDINLLKSKLKIFLLKKAFEDSIKAIDISMQTAYYCLLVKEWANRKLHINEPTNSILLQNKIMQIFKGFEREARNTDFRRCYMKIKNHLVSPLTLLDEMSTIRKVRNCLVHGNGIVTEKYVNDRQNNSLKLKWISMKMYRVSNGKEDELKIGGVLNPGDIIFLRKRNREFVKFNIGESISLNLQQIYDIIYMCNVFANELSSKIVI